MGHLTVIFQRAKCQEDVLVTTTYHMLRVWTYNHPVLCMDYFFLALLVPSTTSPR